MSWLVRLEVNAEIAYGEGVHDTYAWHRKLWECFPDKPDAGRDFLTRIDPIVGAFRIWVLARTKPFKPRWCPDDGFALKEISPAFFSHRYYAFDLCANPVKRIVQRGPNGETLLRPDGKRMCGKRVPLVRHDELREWLSRKGEARRRDKDTGLDEPGGFRIIEEKRLEISPIVRSHFSRKGQPGCHGGVRFRGVLEVTNRERFVDTYHSGVGSAKGFGFGLLLIAPVNFAKPDSYSGE